VNILIIFIIIIFSYTSVEASTDTKNCESYAKSVILV